MPTATTMSKRLLTCALFAACLAVPAGATDPAPRLSVLLAPISAEGRAEAIGSVDVTLRFDDLQAPEGAALLRLPLVVSNVDTVATIITELDARDAKGALRLRWRDVDRPETGLRDAVTGGPSREWIADRPVLGPVTIRYNVPAAAQLPPRGAAPPFSSSDDGGGFSAAGLIFLLLPPNDVRYRATFDWDLTRAPAASRGISSLGEGRRTADEPFSIDELGTSFFMAGPIGTWPASVPDSGFFGAWQGSPCFDAGELLAWTGGLYDHYVRFFGQRQSPSYAVFLRHNKINAGGGVGLHRSFVTTFGKDSCENISAIRITLAHEMFHTFQPFITEPGGLESSWFGEGLATFYQTHLPFRFGMLSSDNYIADINSTAARYYTSVMARVPNSEVPKRFWADTRVRTLPYDRGMLYFASVDDALRKSSGGKTSLDTLVMALLERGQDGSATRNADWEAVLDQYLGPKAVQDFRAFIGGEMPLPATDAFGPCFQRVTKRLRRYELGFEPAVLAEPRRVVRGLIARSAAAKAGLRNGDEIVDPVPQDAIQGEQTRLLTLRIKRGDAAFSVTYLPRGETVDAWQWETIAGTEGHNCTSRAQAGG